MSNCLFFVIGKWWRKGGHVIIRKSHWGWWPHFIWSPDLKTFEQYQPLIPNDYLWFPPPWFHGYVKITTAEEAAARPRFKKPKGSVKPI